MRIKGTVIALIGFFLFLAAGIPPAEASTPLKKLGQAPFYKAKNLKADDVYPLVVRFKKDVANGFTQAGAAELFEPFMEQLKKTKAGSGQRPARPDPAVDDVQEKGEGPRHPGPGLGRKSAFRGLSGRRPP